MICLPYSWDIHVIVTDVNGLQLVARDQLQRLNFVYIVPFPIRVSVTSSQSSFLYRKSLCAAVLSQCSDWAVGWTTGVRLRVGCGRGFVLFPPVSVPALRLTQPPVTWVLAVMSAGVKRRTHLHLMSKLRTRGAIPFLPLRLHGVVLG
jgi:hypothetical protein